MHGWLRGQIGRSLSVVRQTLIDVGPWVFLLCVMVTTVAALTTIQAPSGDYGIWVSVAERLRAGDALYLNVWDNKDPLVYWLLAAARFPHPLGGWLLDVGRLMVCCIAATSLSRSVNASPSIAALVGFAATPLLLAPGQAPIPGIASGLLTIALVMRSRFALAGLTLALVFFSRITLFPVIAAAVVVVLISGRSWPSLRRLIMGALGGSIVMVAILALRDELGPYLHSLVLNTTYAQQGDGEGGGVVSRSVERLHQVISPPLVLATCIALGLSVIVFFHPRVARVTGTLAAAGLAMTVIALAVITVMGKWPGHAALLLPGFIVTLVCFISVITNGVRYPRVRDFIVVLVVAFVLGGIPQVKDAVNGLIFWRSMAAAQGKISPRTLELLKVGHSGALYARIGQGDDDAHAIGLDGWNLACPRFHQYWWESERTLNESLSCMNRAEFVLVAPSLHGPVTTPTWDAFVTKVEIDLTRKFACTPFEHWRVCVRRTGS